MKGEFWGATFLMDRSRSGVHFMQNNIEGALQKNPKTFLALQSVLCFLLNIKQSILKSDNIDFVVTFQKLKCEDGGGWDLVVAFQLSGPCHTYFSSIIGKQFYFLFFMAFSLYNWPALVTDRSAGLAALSSLATDLIGLPYQVEVCDACFFNDAIFNDAMFSNS